MMIRVRFAPSPTGFLHIGGARTALFNWMYARSQNGKFILRIEDTDQTRSKKEYQDEILDSMKWLGFDWDELYHQSERFEIYREYANRLLNEGKAYKDGEAVILTMPPQQEIKIFDLIRGEIIFDTSTLKDQVLLKSDGSPAYSFCCVVDDALMEISHVVRGEDHISNTPKQIVIYHALGLKVPKFAHLPLIMDAEGARLSKRAGAVAVSDYRKQGFLPEALVNYLMLLGWSPGNNQEIVGLDSAVKKFSIKKINKAAAAFSVEKLKWINAQYIKQTDIKRLVDLLIPFLKEKGYVGDKYDGKDLANIVDLYKGRLSTLVDFLDWTDFLFVDPLHIDEALIKEYDLKDRQNQFRQLSQKIQSLQEFDAASAEKTFRSLVDELGIKAGDLVHPVRVALTGKKVGPGLFDTMVLLGQERTARRLEEAVL
jgi:glutamyl-tRNA synthetase